MNAGMALGRFDFDKQLIFDKKIITKPILDPDAIMLNCNHALSFHRNTIAPQAFKQQRLVNTFQQARPKIPVQPKAAIDTVTSKHFNLHKDPFVS